MRVLIVSGIWPPEVGGPASHGPEFGGFLLERGHDVVAVTTAMKGGPDLQAFPVRAARKDRPAPVRQPAAAAAVVGAARGVDVIYATSMYGRSACASLLHRTPLVIKLVNDPAYERARRIASFDGTLEEFQAVRTPASIRAVKLYRDLTMRRASRLVIPSEYLARIASGWGVPAELMRVIPNPAPELGPLPSRAELRERLGVHGPTFVFAGRLTAQKNLPLAVAALGRVEGRLVVIGSGPAEPELRRAISEAGLEGRIDLMGALPRAEAIEWMRAADVTILPSDWENFPHAAVESLAVGTPVVATSVGGVPEIVEPGMSGLLVARGDVAALAEAMTAAVGDHTLRDGAAAAAARYSQPAIYAAIERELIAAATSTGSSAG